MPKLRKAPDLSLLHNYVTASAMACLQATGVAQKITDCWKTVHALNVTDVSNDAISAVLDFLEASELVRRRRSGNLWEYRLSKRGQNELRAAPWYDLIMRGYGDLFLAKARNLAPLKEGRNFKWIARGSARLGALDFLPGLKAIARRLKGVRTVFDVGTGSGEWLLEYCKLFPGAKIVGCEPADEARQDALRLVRSCGQSRNIRVVNAGLKTFIPPRDASVVVLGFVLHELCGIEGPEAVQDLLLSYANAAPNATFIVVEVDARFEEARGEDYARNYYSAYFLIHKLTSQQLLSRQRWKQIFSAAGLQTISVSSAPTGIDPTGFLLIYELRARTSA